MNHFELEGVIVQIKNISPNRAKQYKIANMPIKNNITFVDVNMKDEGKSLPELIFDNIVKTHQAPRCKVCGKAFPRLNQETGICDSCQSKIKTDKGKTLDRWLNGKKKYERSVKSRLAQQS